jgi:nitrogen fixation NifU-like protein
MPAGYSEKVMDHFMHPRNVGEMENPDGVGKVGNPICVLPDTLIHGNSSIEQIKDIGTGGQVLGHDGNYHEVLKIFKKEHNKKVYTVKTHNLGETTTTPDHHILALRTSRFAYKRKASVNLTPDWFLAGELQKGDIILYPVPKETRDEKFIDFDIPKPKWDFKSKKLPARIPVNDDFLRLAGYYLSEGYVRTDKCKGTLGFVFCDREIGYLTDVIFIMKRLFNLEPSTLRNQHNSSVLEFYSARLARFFEKLFGKGAAAKSLPHWMMLLPPEKQKALVCGLWRGDGYINNRGSKYVTISQTLAYQLKLLLLRQKIIFSFLTTAAKGMHKQHYSIYVKEDNSLRKLADIVGMEISRPVKKKSPYKSWYDDRYYYVPIREIREQNYTGKVYNLEVAESHSYVSSSLALHNCGDIMEMYIKVKDGVIVDAKFKTFGCGAAIATSSMATELVKGKTIDEALKLTNKAVAEALGGLPAIKMHCSVLAEDAFKAAVNDYLLKTTGKGLPGFKPHDEPLTEH